MGGRRIPFHSNEERNFPTDSPQVATNLSGSDGNGRATGAHTPGGDSGAGGGPVRRMWKFLPGSAAMACLIGPGATPPASTAKAKSLSHRQNFSVECFRRVKTGGEGRARGAEIWGKARSPG